jgi:hypothetical protein
VALATGMTPLGFGKRSRWIPARPMADVRHGRHKPTRGVADAAVTEPTQTLAI